MNTFSACHFTKPLQFHLLLVPYQTSHLIGIFLMSPDHDSKLVRQEHAHWERPRGSLSPPLHTDALWARCHCPGASGPLGLWSPGRAPPPRHLLNFPQRFTLYPSLISLFPQADPLRCWLLTIPATASLLVSVPHQAESFVRAEAQVCNIILCPSGVCTAVWAPETCGEAPVA